MALRVTEQELKNITSAKSVAKKPSGRRGKRGPQLHQAMVNTILEYLATKGSFAEFKQGRINMQGRWVHFGKKPGWPDIVGCTMHWSNNLVGGFGIGVGRFLSFEVKLGSDRQSPDQIAMQREIEINGGKYYVVSSVEDVMRAFGE